MLSDETTVSFTPSAEPHLPLIRMLPQNSPCLHQIDIQGPAVCAQTAVEIELILETHLLLAGERRTTRSIWVLNFVAWRVSSSALAGRGRRKNANLDLGCSCRSLTSRPSMVDAPLRCPVPCNPDLLGFWLVCNLAGATIKCGMSGVCCCMSLLEGWKCAFKGQQSAAVRDLKF